MWKTLKRGRVISLKGHVWAHKTSLTPPLFIVPNQEYKRKCRYAINIDFVSFYGFCYWFLELLRQLDNICFPFYFYNFSIGFWKCFHSVVFLCFFPFLLLSYDLF
jgi:hypothetical protein